MVIVLNDYHVGFAFGFSYFTNCMLLESLWVPLSYAPWFVAKFLYSCHCLFDELVELHAIDEKCTMTCALKSECGSCM